MMSQNFLTRRKFSLLDFNSYSYRIVLEKDYTLSCISKKAREFTQSMKFENLKWKLTFTMARFFAIFSSDHRSLPVCTTFGLELICLVVTNLVANSSLYFSQQFFFVLLHFTKEEIQKYCAISQF